MRSRDIEDISYKSNDSVFKRVTELENQFDLLPHGSVERKQNIRERAKLLGINI